MTLPRIGVLGDDLTGVAAVLAEASAIGLPCAVTSADGAPPQTAVWGINLDSRDGASGGTAAAAVARLRNWGAQHLLFKIDSLWRGDPMALIGVAATLGTPVVVSGAAPASLPGATLIAEANPFLAATALRDLHCAGQTLWVGGVGLLTVVLWSGVADPAPVTCIVGSYQPNIAGQVAAFRALGGVSLAAGLADLGTAIGRNRLTLIESIPTTGTPDTLLAEAGYLTIAEALAPHLADKPFGLILTGGHTAAAVLRNLGADRLDLAGPSAAEGAPLLVASALPQGLIATKPGHFGGPDALARIAVQMQLRLSA